MATRIELQTILESITEHVYFQAPTSMQLKYPCIMYERDSSKSDFADNKPYRHTKRYQVTVIDRNPDTQIPDQVEALPYCSFDRYFPADSLNHYVFNLFF